jgi:hypothetical protein
VSIYADLEREFGYETVKKIRMDCARGPNEVRINSVKTIYQSSSLRPEGTSFYTQGVEVPLEYSGEIPDGFEIIELPPCKMLIFQGPPYEDEKFMGAIGDLWKQTKNYKPKIYGYEWDNEIAPQDSARSDGIPWVH